MRVTHKTEEEGEGAETKQTMGEEKKLKPIHQKSKERHAYQQPPYQRAKTQSPIEDPNFRPTRKETEAANRRKKCTHAPYRRKKQPEKHSDQIGRAHV